MHTVMREFKDAPKDGRKITAFCVGYCGSEIKWNDDRQRWEIVDEYSAYPLDLDNWPITHVTFQVSEKEFFNSYFAPNDGGLIFDFERTEDEIA